VKSLLFSQVPGEVGLADTPKIIGSAMARSLAAILNGMQRAFPLQERKPSL
jgi:hypothetical protein